MKVKNKRREWSDLRCVEISPAYYAGRAMVTILRWLFLVAIAFIILYPLMYMLSMAFRSPEDFMDVTVIWLPKTPTWDNFRTAVVDVHLVDALKNTVLIAVQSQSLVAVERYVFNSVFVAVVSTGGYILLASMAGYAMAKMKFPGKTVIYRVIVFAILFRPEVTALPQYMLMAKTGMLDTFWALILPTMSTSFGVFLMSQFISAIPDDVLEAARIDGAGEKYTFFKIVLPMMRPAWMTLMILTFISSWNVTGAQFTYSESMKMLPTMMQQINTGGIIRTGVTAAVSVLLMLPPIGIFLVCENAVVETMAYSGIKS